MTRFLAKTTRRVAWLTFGFLLGYHLGLQDAAMGARPRCPHDS